MWKTSAATPPLADALAWVFEHQMMMPIAIGVWEESGVGILHARAWMSASGRLVSRAARRALADGP